ncbi:MAG: BlaI/MecI/CopY family transcriptional regulator [Lachnospiraceae bacterium]|nr:BlaI/MecI/CopY family transcriptional regulator [Lachnospiraceae bacterium]
MNEEKRIPESELKIMQIIWHNETPISRTAIEACIAKEKALASTTILTLLSRLCEKGFLNVTKVGKSNMYEPIISEREYLASESRNIFQSLYGGSVSAFVTALCDSGVSKDDLDELRDMLEKGEL